MYDMPDEIRVAADGPIRIITLNRPDNLNAVNDALHAGLARLWGRLSEDYDARAAVITGAGRQDHRARPRPRPWPGPLPGADRRGGQRPGGRPRLQPGGAVRRRVHGDERLPVRSARVDR